jgi:hypothetical protein
MTVGPVSVASVTVAVAVRVVSVESSTALG